MKIALYTTVALMLASPALATEKHTPPPMPPTPTPVAPGPSFSNKAAAFAASQARAAAAAQAAAQAQGGVGYGGAGGLGGRGGRATASVGDQVVNVIASAASGSGSSSLAEAALLGALSNSGDVGAVAVSPGYNGQAFKVGPVGYSGAVRDPSWQRRALAARFDRRGMSWVGDMLAYQEPEFQATFYVNGRLRPEYVALFYNADGSPKQFQATSRKKSYRKAARSARCNCR